MLNPIFKGITGWTLLTMATASLAQSVSMRTEMPFVYDVASLGATWAVGDWAEYGIYEDEGMAEQKAVHRIELLSLREEGGKTWYKVRITRREPYGQTSQLEYFAPVLDLDLGKGKDFLMVSGIGRFPLASFTGRPGEHFVKQDTADSIVLDKTVALSHTKVTYSDGKGDCEIWSAADLGPYAIARMIRVYGTSKTHYKLLNHGHKPPPGG